MKADCLCRLFRRSAEHRQMPPIRQQVGMTFKKAPKVTQKQSEQPVLPL